MEYHNINGKLIPKQIVVLEFSLFFSYWETVIGQVLTLEIFSDHSTNKENPLFIFKYLEGDIEKEGNIFLRELDGCKYVPADKYEKLKAFL